MKPNKAPCCGVVLPQNTGGASQYALLKTHLGNCTKPEDLVRVLNDYEEVFGLPRTALPQPGPAEEKTKAVQKWADEAMFSSAPLDATTGPQVHVLSMSPDPLGEIAAAKLMYQGVVVKDLADVTDDQRREAFAQIRATKLKAPFEFVKLHLLFDGVTRSFTHQLVRQRTAAYAQESLRFAVVEDGFATRVALPPSLAGTRPSPEEGRWEVDERAMGVMTPEQRWRYRWDKALDVLEWAYQGNVNDGMPAEDARGLLPHNITTRVHYTTDLRALVDHAGNRLCTQAQFEWRSVFIKLVQALRDYGKRQEYRTHEAGRTAVATWDPEPGGVMRLEHGTRSSAWQYDLLAELFRPACYLTGKCEFAAMDLDRKCSIRDRVDANASIGRPSSQWGTTFVADRRPNPVTEPHAVELNWPWVTAKKVEGNEVPDKPCIPAIDPAEWLTRPDAAR